MPVHTLFRIFYNTLFSILNLVLLVLLVITPADAIHQAISNGQYYNISVIAGCYLLTLVAAVVIYASRLYTTRSVLAGIPKTWVPVEKGDVSTSTRRMIARSLQRSAVIAWDSRPRVLRQTGASEEQQDEQDGQHEGHEREASKSSKVERSGCCGLPLRRRTRLEKETKEDTLPLPLDFWDCIAHGGWSSPTANMHPNLQYTAVVQELPHLIEAKAVSLAPSMMGVPDAACIELLQRPVAMGLRDYITHLLELQVLTPCPELLNFLSSYELARFSSSSLEHASFNILMALFADVLRSMKPLNPDMLAESDIDDDIQSGTTHRTASRRSSRVSSRAERQHRSSSAGSSVHGRRPYNGSEASSTRSVIRLNHVSSGEGMPYTIDVAAH